VAPVFKEAHPRVMGLMGRANFFMDDSKGFQKLLSIRLVSKKI
jgi:hypothetical protein